MKYITCPKCDEINSGSIHFCSNCGANLKNTTLQDMMEIESTKPDNELASENENNLGHPLNDLFMEHFHLGLLLSYSFFSPSIPIYRC